MITRASETHNYTMNEYQADMAHTAIYKDKIIYLSLIHISEPTRPY